MLPFQGAEIVRTRDEAALEPLDVVLDVGGVYDPPRRRFDHHQKGFDEIFGHGFATKLSSAGMIYKHFGKELIAQVRPSGSAPRVPPPSGRSFPARASELTDAPSSGAAPHRR